MQFTSGQFSVFIGQGQVVQKFSSTLVMSEQLLCKFGNILTQILSESIAVLVSEVLKEMEV